MRALTDLNFRKLHMSMNIREALNILEIPANNTTKKIIKSNYRQLASKYHPDKNPNGLHRMQLINIAYNYLMSLEDNFLLPWSIATINGITIHKKDGKTRCFGNTYDFKTILKKHGFRWNPQSKSWDINIIYPIENYLRNI